MRTFTKADFCNVFYAHRGLHDREGSIPENSLAAFRKAVEQGYGVELDVQLTLDGQVVVFHDDSLQRMCGVEGKVWEYPLSEIRKKRLLNTQEKVPLFTEALEILSKGSGPLIVELKTGPRNRELCQKTLSILRDWSGMYCVESFDPRIVYWFRRNAPKIVRGQLAQPEENYPLPRLPARLLAKCRLSFLTKPDFIAYRIGPVPRTVERMRQKGTALIGWTSKSAAADAGNWDALIFEHCVPPEGGLGRRNKGGEEHA